MDHGVYLDTQARELENLLSGPKTMLFRGATGRKLPHGRVQAGDVLITTQRELSAPKRSSPPPPIRRK